MDAQAFIAGEQAAAKAVSPAMLAMTSLRHPDSRAKECGPSRRACLLDTVLRATGGTPSHFPGQAPWITLGREMTQAGTDEPGTGDVARA